jgi:hypothetical protein
MFTENGEHVSFPHRIVRLRARGLLAEGSPEQALAEIGEGRRIWPLETGTVARLVPLLDEHGQRAYADEWFESVFAGQAATRR